MVPKKPIRIPFFIRTPLFISIYLYIGTSIETLKRILSKYSVGLKGPRLAGGLSKAKRLSRDCFSVMELKKSGDVQLICIFFTNMD